MPPLPLLTAKDAHELALAAHADFPGLETFLQPIIRPRPLQDDAQIAGYILWVTGPRARPPWFSCSSVLLYEQLYDHVVGYYAPEETEEPEEAEEMQDEGQARVVPLPKQSCRSSRRATHH